MSAHIHEAPSILGLGQNGAYWEIQTFEPPLGHRRMILGPKVLPSQDKSSQPVLAYFLVWNLLSIANSVCAPLFYLSVCVMWHPETPLLWWEAHQSSLPTASFITSWSTRWVHVRQWPWGGCWEGRRGQGDWQPLLKLVCVSSPCEENLCHPSLTAVCFPWWLWYQHTVGRSGGTWAPGDRPQMSLARKTPCIVFIFKVDQVGFLPQTTKISIIINKAVFCFQ